MFIIEKFNKENSHDYFAMLYKIKYNDDREIEKEVKIDPSFNAKFVRKSYKKESEAVEKIDLTDDNLKCFRLTIVPEIIRGKDDRDVIYISGSGGSGKSYLVDQINLLYQKLNNGKTYFFTANDPQKDTSLTHEKYHFVNLEKFFDQFGADGILDHFSKTSGLYDNSMLIFDDIGAVKDKRKKKILWDFIDIVLENKRKNNIYICVISHVPTNYTQTQLIIRETKKYVVYPRNLQVKSDRFLKTYLGLSSKQLNEITDIDNSKWCCVDVINRILITQRQISNL